MRVKLIRIPTGILTQETEERRRFPLEQRLKEKIVGQEGPISIVASSKMTRCFIMRLSSHIISKTFIYDLLYYVTSYQEEGERLDRRGTSLSISLPGLVGHRQDRVGQAGGCLRS